MTAIFWVSVWAVLYIYLGYPLFIWLLARKWPKADGSVGSAELLGCTVIVSAYNEEAVIEAKCRSVLASRGAEGIREVIVASDGSTDGTVERALAVEDARMVVRAFEHRRGKPAMLNELMGEVSTPVVVFTDARQLWDEEALVGLLGRFADPAVAVVSGELQFVRKVGDGTVAEGMGVYWRYEKFIRRHEGIFASVPGASGALYALRSALYKEIPEDLILDDVGIPMQAVLMGGRCVFEAGAVVTDEASSHVEKEAIRKRRTIAGNIQMLRYFPGVLVPGLNPIFWQYVSHKVLRLFSPLFLLVAFVSHLFLLAHPFYGGLFFLHVLFYFMALLGWVLQESGIRSGWVGAPLVFVGLNVSTVLAWGDAFLGRFSAVWDRSDKV